MRVQLGCEVILGCFAGADRPRRAKAPAAGPENAAWPAGPGVPAAGTANPPRCPEHGTAQLALYRQAGRHAAKSSRNSFMITPVFVTFIG
jgi:hypothetical protein